MAKIDSLWVALGFKVDAKSLEKFEKLAEKAKSTMIGIGAAVIGAATGIGIFTKRAVDDLDGIGDFAEAVGASAREIDAMGEVALMNDSSLEAMKGAIMGITQATGQAAVGLGRGAMLFKKFGLSAKNADGTTKTFRQVMGDIADKMETMDRTKRLTLGSRLGLDPALVTLLAKGRAHFEALVEEAEKGNPFAAKDYELAGEADNAFKRANHRMRVLRNQIAVTLMPRVIELLNAFSKWMREENNVRKLRRALEQVTDVLAFLAKNLKTIGVVFGALMTYKMGAYFLDWGEKAAKAVKAMGSLGAAGGLLKTVLTGGLIAAIVLVAEDLWTFYRGGESVTGLLLKKFPLAVETTKAALLGMGAALLALTTGSGPVGIFAFAIGGIVLAAFALRDAWNPIMQWWDEQWSKLADKIAGIWNALPQPIRAALGIATGGLLGSQTGAEMATSESIASSRARISEGTANWRPWQSAGGSQQTTNITGVHINLPNVTNPQEAARETARALTRLAHGGVGG